VVAIEPSRKRNEHMKEQIKTVVLVLIGLAFVLFVLRAMAWADKGMYEQGNTMELLPW
jgi:hypothetical protein